MTQPLTQDDQELLQAIFEATGEPDVCARLVHQYYGDLDRADRTPRRLLYLHLGILSGLIERLVVDFEEGR